MHLCTLQQTPVAGAYRLTSQRLSAALSKTLHLRYLYDSKLKLSNGLKTYSP